ncbi:MAG: helix-turn-helix domain-containing protein [Chromatiales bacterium]|nr:helix-turn-helix domain-containing protein [Chromatiales bacterium]
MRGEELKEIRRQNLLRLRQRHTLEQIAERTGTNSVYLSQIANRVVQKNGKSPRALSDAYAGKIEHGLGLPEGWMDQDHDPATIEAKVQVQPDDLPLTASGYIEVMPEPTPAVAAVLSSDEIEWLQLYHELPPEQREAIKTIAGKTSQKKE